jgi:hypothetical protein
MYGLRSPAAWLYSRKGRCPETEMLMQACDGDNCHVRITEKEALPFLNQKK